MGENAILKLGYLEKFKTDRTYFKDNLYKNQEVFLTEDQYKLYSKLEIEGYSNNDILEKLDKRRTNERYGKIRIREGLDLKMEDYLNLINLELGYDFLPDIYKEAPIYINSVNGGLEEVGNFASRDIARLALLNKEPLELVIGDLTGLDKSIVYKDLVLFGSDTALMKYFMEIRMASLNILMDKSYRLKERLILLRIFYEHLQGLNTHDRVDLVEDKIEELMKFFASNNYRNFFKSLPENEYLNLDIMKYLLSIDIKDYSKGQASKEIGDSFEKFRDRDLILDLRTSYLENKKIYDKWKEENIYILENYLINEFIKELLPYSESGNILDAYNLLISDYIVLEAILLSSSLYSGSLEENLFLDKLTSYAKFKIEYPDYLLGVRDYMNLKGYFNVESLSIIL